MFNTDGPKLPPNDPTWTWTGNCPSCDSLRAEVAALKGVAEAAKECSRQYFYDNDADYNDVAYDEAMKALQDALREVKGD